MTLRKNLFTKELNLFEIDCEYEAYGLTYVLAQELYAS